MTRAFEQLNRKEIDQPDEKPFEPEKEPKKQQEKLSKELQQYQKQGQEMIDSYQGFFMTFAKDISLDFKMSNRFTIDLENGEVNLDTKWFAEKEFSIDQILWANLHELAHFRDLAADPEQMMKSFEYIRNQAKKTGAKMMKKWEERYGETDPDLIESLKKQRPISKKDPSKTMNAVEQVAYKIHHTFYNVFDDIYVNNLVARKAPKYEKGERGGEVIKGLYQKKLFVKTDYSELPQHLQFVYKLIREEMVEDEALDLSKEVEAIMDKKIAFQGKEYTPKEIVDSFIKPKGSRDTKVGQRYFVLQKTLEPIFEELLSKDLEEWEPEKPEQQNGEGGEPQEGEINPFSDEYQEFDQNNPDQIDQDDIKDWLDKHKENKKKEEEQKAKEKEEESKSAEERAKKAQEQMDKNWCQKHNIKHETLQEFRKIEAEVEPYLTELSQLWQKIIFGYSRKIERGIEGYFKNGTELDIPKVIEEWPKIDKGKIEETRVMKRVISKEVLIRKPELIRVRLVGDMSISMNSEKRHVLQQCFVLLLSSLREFNTHLNFTRSQTKSKLEADSEAWIFGDSTECVKRLRSESGLEDEQVEIIKIFERLQSTIGLTYDNKTLEEILNSLTPEDKKRIEQEKIMELVCEITDGGSSDKENARKAVDNLEETKIIPGAFQIGKVSKEEKQIFNFVWNEGREEPRGFFVGEELKALLPAITKWLKKYLSNVRL